MTELFDFTCSRCGGHVQTAGGRCALCGAAGAPPQASEAPPRGATLAGGLAAAPSPPHNPLLGQVVADRFRVNRLIGEGGVGRVYHAWQEGLDRAVALKVLHAEAAATPDQKARFHREARAASRLSHPGCVVVYDFGEWAGQLYIAMEYLEGRTLADVIDGEYPLPPERIVSLLGQVCDALAAAHDAGVLHRDLKPENILVLQRPDGSEATKLVDFGLAILHEGAQMERLTQEGMVSGTPAYMSPEQCRGKEMDARSDLYSLGIILYEMLAGEVPFDADSPVEILVQHLFNPPRPPSERVREAPVHAGLEALALEALAKAPFERPPSARAFAARLRSALSMDPAAPTRGRSSSSPLTREGRADLAGLPRLPASTQMDRPSLPDAPEVLLMPAQPPGPVNLGALLAANSLPASTASTLEEAMALVPQRRPAAILLDLGADLASAGPRLERLAMLLTEGTLAGAPVVVAGPAEDLSLMQRALTIGVAHYVPHGALPDRLPRILRRLHKRALRRRARAKTR